MLQRVLFWALPIGAEEDIPHFDRARGNQHLPCSISAHSCPPVLQRAQCLLSSRKKLRVSGRLWRLGTL